MMISFLILDDELDVAIAQRGNFLRNRKSSTHMVFVKEMGIECSFLTRIFFPNLDLARFPRFAAVTVAAGLGARRRVVGEADPELPWPNPDGGEDDEDEGGGRRRRHCMQDRFDRSGRKGFLLSCWFSVYGAMRRRAPC